MTAQRIFFGRVELHRPRVAWMFPGQGSQYPDMLRVLARDFAPAAASIQKADEVLRRLGFESFSQVAWEQTQGLGNEIWRTQLAVLIANNTLAESLRALGHVPDVVAGHSFGEYAALLTAGAWSLENALRCTKLRADSLERGSRGEGGMVAVFASRADTERLLERAGGTVYLANENAPLQCVVAGDRQGIQRVAAIAKQMGISTFGLPIPCPFHCPLLTDAQALFSAGAPAIPIDFAQIPVVSTCTNRVMTSPADIRESLCRQLTEPVRYLDLVRQLDQEEPTLFVEVGPQRILTSLNHKILGRDCNNSIATDETRRPGLEQLLCVSALLKSLGLGEKSMSQEPAAGGGAIRIGKLREFDATQRRREARRQKAAGETRPATAPAKPPRPNRPFNNPRQKIAQSRVATARPIPSPGAAQARRCPATPKSGRRRRPIRG